MTGTLHLTRFKLDARHKPTRLDLADLRQMHRTLMRLLPEDLGPSPRAAGGLLYRVDNRNDRPPALLVQTTVAPNLSSIDRPWAGETIDASHMLTAFTKDRRVRYTCKTTPLKRESATRKETGLFGEAADEWWHQKLGVAGLKPSGEWETQQDTLRIDQRVIACSTFTGVAFITGASDLVNAVTKGIGRNKTWGCGLLSLAPA